MQEHDAENDRNDRVRRRGGRDDGRIRVPDPEVEGDVSESVDDRDQRNRGEKPRRAVGKAPFSAAKRNGEKEERREPPGEEDWDEPPVGRTEVGDPVDERADRDRGDECQEDPEERNPFAGLELGEV